MKYGTACAIFLNIDSPKYSVEENGEAIRTVLQMETHNGIKKDAMLKVIRYLFALCFDVEGKA